MIRFVKHYFNKYTTVIAAFVMCILVLSALALSEQSFKKTAHTAHASSYALTGYAWSDNIGWISFNCTTDTSGCGSAAGAWGVGVNNDNTLSGYAWSENIGWINFGSNSCGTQATMTNGALTGWAQAPAAAGGWDGCIKLADVAAPAYGPTLTGSDFNGYSWGSDVTGWISYNCLTGGNPSTPQTATFTSGTNSWTVPAGVYSMSYLIVAGGGGGGYANDRTSGGGGAGGVLNGTIPVTPGTVYTITVGAGGVGSSNGINPTNGGNSSIATSTAITVYGGGLGGFYGATCWSGGNGGGGGGGYHNSCSSPGGGYIGQARYGGWGYDGGNGTNGTFTAGGGGGAVLPGANSTAGSGGAGGMGTTSSISGTSVTYGGGGGGGCQQVGTGSCVGGAGGAGGGGAGGRGINGTASSGAAGATNTGGGGGGGGSGGVGGYGGSGIVILSYTPTPNICPTSNYKVSYNGPTVAPTCTITATPNPASTGTSINLNYTTTNTPSIGTIKDPSNATITTAATSPSGAVAATAPSPAGTYNYTMTVSSPAGSGSCSTATTGPLVTKVDLCTDIAGLQNPSPAYPCVTPYPSPGACLQTGVTWNGTQCVITGPFINNFSASARVRSGNVAVLNYTASNVVGTCRITGTNGYDSGAFTPGNGTPGQATTTPITGNSRFTLDCGSVTRTINVGITPTYIEQ